MAEPRPIFLTGHVLSLRAVGGEWKFVPSGKSPRGLLRSSSIRGGDQLSETKK
jgi:hypothetical protein